MEPLYKTPFRTHEVTAILYWDEVTYCFWLLSNHAVMLKNEHCLRMCGITILKEIYGAERKAYDRRLK
jgi:hypothetical protein